jgi:hypothetical protein
LLDRRLYLEARLEDKFFAELMPQPNLLLNGFLRQSWRDTRKQEHSK